MGPPPLEGREGGHQGKLKHLHPGQGGGGAGDTGIQSQVPPPFGYEGSTVISPLEGIFELLYVRLNYFALEKVFFHESKQNRQISTES